METRKLTPGEYCEGLLDICQFLHCELEYFLTCDGRFHGAAKTFWWNMKDAWIRMNTNVSEDDIEIYGRILAVLRGTVCKEFVRLKFRRLSEADRIILLIRRLLEIARENCPEDFRFTKELNSAYKANNRFYDNIRNTGKKDSMYLFSSKVRNFLCEGKCGNHTVDDISLFKAEHPEPKKLELRGEKTVLIESGKSIKRTEIKF